MRAMTYLNMKNGKTHMDTCEQYLLAWAWLAKPKAIVIVYQLFRPCHAFTEITELKISAL